MALAHHIQVAIEDGPKAGFRAWVEQMERSGLPQVKARLDEVRAQGNQKAQFSYYCQQFGRQFAKHGIGTASTVQARQEHDDTEVDSLREELAEMQAKLSRMLSTDSEADLIDDSLNDVDEDEILAAAIEEQPKRTRQTRNTGTAQTRQTRRETVKEQAQRDVDYAPRDPDMNCTSGRLWKLNELGLLRIVGTPTDPITCGDAHKVLQKVIGNGK